MASIEQLRREAARSASWRDRVALGLAILAFHLLRGLVLGLLLLPVALLAWWLVG
jgi:hypothetical protein